MTNQDAQVTQQTIDFEEVILSRFNVVIHRTSGD